MKHIFVLLFIATSVCITAQNNFIEVTVEDTVSLKPVKIKYLITDSGTDYTTTYENNKKEENKYAQQTNLTVVEKILTTNKISFSHYIESKSYKIGSTYNWDMDYNTKKADGLLIEVNTIKELENLYNLLKDQKGIEGKIIDVAFESKDIYLESMFKSLFSKAQKEAQIMATLTGLKIGKVISTTEGSSGNVYSILDWYKDIFALGKYEDGMFGKNLTSIYTRKFTFKFEAN